MSKKNPIPNGDSQKKGKKATIMNYFFVFLGFAVLAFITVSLPRQYKNIRRKLETVNTFAIQNVETGKDIRVHNAGIDDGQQWELIEQYPIV